MGASTFRIVFGLACATLTTTLTTTSIMASEPNTDALNRVKNGIIRNMAGCFLIDYNFTETESLHEGYAIDRRVYDVNGNKSVKEWITAVEIGNDRVRLQHVMFFTDLSGAVAEHSFLKHQAEDWVYQPGHWYEFTGPGRWVPHAAPRNEGQWLRHITNLDDGLRYQCIAPWNLNNEYLEWNCANFAPIPGRETRDMGRRDYNTLDRNTRIILYGSNWLERQNNVKTIWTNESHTPLARELGRNWYVRLPDSECEPARSWAAPRLAFWELLRETWDEVLDGAGPFQERTPTGRPPRFAAMVDLEEQFKDAVTQSSETRRQAKDAIRAVIEEYRSR